MTTTRATSAKRPPVRLAASPELAANLQSVLVDLLELAVQGKQAHWNVIGPTFRELHLQLDEIVNLARQGSDTIAERMRALGASPDGRSNTISANTTLPAHPAGEQQTAATIELLLGSLTNTAATLRAVHDAVDIEDPSTADLLHQLIVELEKQAWMLRAQATA